MAKKVEGYIKLQIQAGKATPAPPVGPALGQHGVNIVEFTKQFNAKTADKGDLIIPVVITVYADRITTGPNAEPKRPHAFSTMSMMLEAQEPGLPSPLAAT